MEGVRFTANEKERLEALAEYKILDTAAEKIFDSLTTLASQICDVPISLLVFIDDKRQWFKSTYGVPEELKDIRETARDIAFCAHTILDANLLEVEDLSKDLRFINNPFVTEFPNLRFYAGVPLLTENNLAIGSICVLDQKPKVLNKKQKQSLAILSNIAVALMDAKKNISEITLLGQILENVSSVANPRINSEYLLHAFPNYCASFTVVPAL
jgi:GAF domain-containing protein